jgi:hypothetical protein
MIGEAGGYASRWGTLDVAGDSQSSMPDPGMPVTKRSWTTVVTVILVCLALIGLASPSERTLVPGS